MAQPKWQGKIPADMTDEELRLAKEAVADAIAPVQDSLNSLSAALQHLDAEINVRFRVGNYGQVNPALLPPYPTDYLVGFAPPAEG